MKPSEVAKKWLDDSPSYQFEKEVDQLARAYLRLRDAAGRMVLLGTAKHLSERCPMCGLIEALEETDNADDV